MLWRKPKEEPRKTVSDKELRELERLQSQAREAQAQAHEHLKRLLGEDLLPKG